VGKVLSNPLDCRKRASYAEKNVMGLIYQAYSQSVIQAVSQSLSFLVIYPQYYYKILALVGVNNLQNYCDTV